MTGKLLLAAGLLAIFAAVQNASADTVPRPKPDIAGRELTPPPPEKAEKIQDLKNQRKELLVKIQKRRAELLKNNPKLMKMYLKLLKQARELALELDADRQIQELNEAYLKVVKKLEQAERQEKPEGQQKKSEYGELKK